MSKSPLRTQTLDRPARNCILASFNEFAGSVATAVWLVAKTEGPVPKICWFQEAGLIELELKLSKNMGVAATDFGEASKPAIRGKRITRIASLTGRGLRNDLSELVARST